MTFHGDWGSGVSVSRLVGNSIYKRLANTSGHTNKGQYFNFPDWFIALIYLTTLRVNGICQKKINEWTILLKNYLTIVKWRYDFRSCDWNFSSYKEGYENPRFEPIF